MTTRGDASLVRRPDASNRATLLELLFDVVFVAALALISMLMTQRTSWESTGETLLMLLAIWWIWSVTSVTTDYYDPEQRPIQVILMVSMLGAVAAAAALPGAADGHALVFASAYVAPHLIRGVVLVLTLHRHRHRAQERAARFMFWFTVSGVFWILGALSSEQARWPLWVVALTIDYVAAGARYPIPVLGRVPLEQYEKATEHLGERYQQFVILALGDIILVPTLKISTSDFSMPRLAGFVSAFVTMLLLWQIYVYRSGNILQITSRHLLARASRLGPYTHAMILLGVVCVAVAFDLVVGQPLGHTPARSVVLMLGGPTLLVLGRALFTYRVSGVVPWRRLAWLPVFGILAPFAGGWPPVLVAIATMLVLGGIVVTDVLAPRLRPAFFRPGRVG
ncbi:low temperature requirement protein A [Micromonospora sp. URMC 103]|uniref:low temperature requirement protein A n=1 Tax=Micromonospora sp. URMC 103 TaxID=3423406 RepID=UPI003F1D5612